MGKYIAIIIYILFVTFGFYGLGLFIGFRNSSSIITIWFLGIGYSMIGIGVGTVLVAAGVIIWKLFNNET